MRITQVSERSPALIAQLLALWEGSVRATHLFLSEEEVQAIRVYVPQALGSVQHLLVAERADGCPDAFLGLEGKKVEMLFVSPAERGKGLGKALLQYAISRYGVDELAVNEQNPQARGFYEHMGFRVYRRTQQDEQGNPYPLLYMRRTSSGT